VVVFKVPLKTQTFHFYIFIPRVVAQMHDHFTSCSVMYCMTCQPVTITPIQYE